MSAIQRVCKGSTSVKNTGTDSDLLPAVTAMLFIVSKDFSFTLADLATDISAVKFFTDAIHDDRPDRIFPLFGNQVQIQGQTNNKAGDTSVTLDDGTPIFIQYGTTSKVFYTTQGGLCFAKVIQSFNNTNFRIIEVDIQGNIACAYKGNGVYGGLKYSSLFAPAIDFADFKNPAKTYFQVSYRPDVYLSEVKLLSGGEILKELLGLTDLSLLDATGSTITDLNVDVADDCCDDAVSSTVLDAIATAGAAAFDVIDLADGSDVPLTGVTVVGTSLALAGTFIVGHTYRVSGTLASVLYNNGTGLAGYEITGSVDITV